MRYKIYWSDQALETYEQISTYIFNDFGQAAWLKFEARVERVINLLVHRPTTFRRSERFPEYRRLLLSKQTTLFFEIRNGAVYLLLFWENARDPETLGESLGKPD